eukprot:CAMPEP_0202505010 /NCGR_PEP_ID=MMETSP1361-20130828/46287_1 /ASSEMBLY_ACC=CAM_ASM_000849 /TAXON_ID=210615 /ORGANISM="Staurosira complex sp., Strain CCMP2646" /LENGTH=67 /DNA_ID=CAMNT_0049138681 /DNA_START=44 /DNA_END=243 /DNA_ORIENTATION=+
MGVAAISASCQSRMFALSDGRSSKSDSIPHRAPTEPNTSLSVGVTGNPSPVGGTLALNSRQASTTIR